MRNELLTVLLALSFQACTAQSTISPVSITISDDDPVHVSNDSLQAVSLTPVTCSKLQQMLKTGDNIKVVAVWASWCTYCKPLLNDLSSLRNEYSADRIKFYTLSGDVLNEKQEQTTRKKLYKTGNLAANYIMDGTPPSEVDFLNRKGIEQYMSDLKTSFKSHPGFPYITVFDEQGNVLAEFTGYDEQIKKALVQKLNELLK